MKQLLRTHLAAYDLSAVETLAAEKRRALSYLVALTYETDPLLAWRAIEAFGAAAARIADQDAEFVRGHLRRLLWLLSDESGGIGWRAPELLGEALRQRPRQFSEFMPILASLLDMEPEDAGRFRAGTLWAIGRVAEAAREPMQAARAGAAAHLGDVDPQVRGLAVWCLPRLGYEAALEGRQALLADHGAVTLYHAGALVRTRVSDLARAALRGVGKVEVN